MRKPTREVRRVLAIDPRGRGFGFAVLEGPDNLIDWGVKQPPRLSAEWCLAQIGALAEIYHLDLIVVEDTAAKGCRRSARVRELIMLIRRLTRKRKIPTRAISRRAMRKVFLMAGAANKHQVAAAIAARFGELAPHVPPRRKPWMGEHHRMAIFDALALGLTFFQVKGDRSLFSCIRTCRSTKSWPS